MIISAKSLSGEYVSIEISDNSSRIEEEFEQRYKELYVHQKFRPFISVSLLETSVFYNDDDECITSEWSFLVNTHKLALCLDRYKDSWMSLCLNPHPYIIEMFEELDQKEKQTHIYKGLSRNPLAIDFLRKNPDKISWSDMLRYNNRVHELLDIYNVNKERKISEMIKHSPYAYDLICKYRNKQFNCDDILENKHIQPEWVQYIIDNELYGKNIVWGEYVDSEGNVHGEFHYKFRLTKKHWKKLSKMPVMIPLLRKYIFNICWKELCENSCSDAVDLIREYPDKVVLSSLCNNHTAEAISFLEEINPDLDINKKAWSILCRNPYAVHIIEKYRNSIKYLELSKNTNERAIELLKIHLSIPTLSKHYREIILKKLIENDNAGWLVLELFEKGEFDHLDYEYSYKILTKPYIFCPTM